MIDSETAEKKAGDTGKKDGGSNPIAVVYPPHMPYSIPVMAHRKAGGSAKSLRDSNPKYLGIKRGNGSSVRTGEILVRQRGLKILPGDHVAVGNDHTLFAKQDGTVRFTSKRKATFAGVVKKRIVANVT